MPDGKRLKNYANKSNLENKEEHAMKREHSIHSYKDAK